MQSECRRAESRQMSPVRSRGSHRSIKLAASQGLADLVIDLLGPDLMKLMPLPACQVGLIVYLESPLQPSHPQAPGGQVRCRIKRQLTSVGRIGENIIRFGKEDGARSKPPMVGLQFQGFPLPVGDEAVIAVGGEEGQLGTGRGFTRRTMSRTGAASGLLWKGV